jgi:hypothetical protein
VEFAVNAFSGKSSLLQKESPAPTRYWGASLSPAQGNFFCRKTAKKVFFPLYNLIYLWYID